MTTTYISKDGEITFILGEKDEAETLYPMQIKNEENDIKIGLCYGQAYDEDHGDRELFSGIIKEEFGEKVFIETIEKLDYLKICFPNTYKEVEKKLYSITNGIEEGVYYI